VEGLNNTVFEDLVTTALPPSAKLMQLLFGKQITYSIAAVARLGVADHMSATPVAIDLLAEKVGAQTPSLYRVMRMLSSVGVFRQTERQFSLTPVGELLRSDHKNSARYRAMLRGEEWTTRAYEHFADCVRTGLDGVTGAYGKNMFELLAERPDQADTFHRAMTDSSALSSQAILQAYDFSGIKRLADVGGGHGSFLCSILRKYPGMQGVLYDLPEVLSTIPPSQFAGCESRIHLEGGSFFARAPEGCDAYILKHILHNWSDNDCIRILTLLRELLPAHGRVLICEMVIQSDPAPTPAKMLDIEMLLLTVGGKERSAEEFQDVLASTGLRIGRIVPTPSPLCVVEAFDN
jgi:O-methyltransferase domain